MATRIYTRGGDEGETGLWGGNRVPKSSLRVASYGDVDELNAALGVARAAGVPPAVDEVLDVLQHQLFDLGAELSTPPNEEAPARVSAEDVAWLEGAIDRAEAELPKLKQFILPGGTAGAAALHLARTICRRAERATVALRHAEPETSPVVLQYVNRLSDLLFVLARRANHGAGQGDVPWRR